MRPTQNANARLLPGERARLTDYARIVAPAAVRINSISFAGAASKAEPRKRKAHNRRERSRDAYGTVELCTWPVGGGVCRFQTRNPTLAKKLSQRRGARLVAWSVHGGYLRVFEERIEPWRARDLVRRFLRATNGAFFDPKRPATRRKSPQAANVEGGVA
jgi:hypothetical protein